MTNGSDIQILPHKALAKESVFNGFIGQDPFIAVNEEKNELAIAFSSRIGNKTYYFARADSKDLATPKTFDLPVFRDNTTRSRFNMRGDAIDGPLEGVKLEQLPAYNAFWFARVAFSSLESFYSNSSIIWSSSFSAGTYSNSVPWLLFEPFGAFALIGAMGLAAWHAKKRS